VALIDIKLFPIQEQLLEELIQGIDSEAELTPFTASETLDAGLIYAPYIPLYVTPTVQLSELYGHRFYTEGWKLTRYKIPKYNDIYSDIKERFELLDL
jgi:hypothetical protein